MSRALFYPCFLFYCLKHRAALLPKPGHKRLVVGLEEICLLLTEPNVSWCYILLLAFILQLVIDTCIEALFTNHNFTCCFLSSWPLCESLCIFKNHISEPKSHCDFSELTSQKSAPPYISSDFLRKELDRGRITHLQVII